jgi:hypothetical protein
MKLAMVGLATCLLAVPAVAQQHPQSTVAPPNTTSSNSHNPIVAPTSNANDQAVPAKGSNSFTESQAQSRIADRGYSHVSTLRKDDNGVWRGTAERNGQPVKVWLDYKANVGEAH